MARIFFILFSLSLFAAGILDYFHLTPSPKLSEEAITVFFVINIFVVCLITWLTIQYYVKQRDQFRKQIDEKNIKLELTLSELKQTQVQLIQSEKMASLGQLTAGVAHEINNPINFVSANIQPLKRNLSELKNLMEEYEAIISSTNGKEVIENLQKKFEKDFTIAESENLLKGIEEGSKRTADIVKGLRNFSRLDEVALKKADINEGIESTLVLVQNKMNEHNIEVIKSLGDIPRIECYPGQLNQVWMNLLTNAIDAIGNNGKIFIATSSENNYLKISIRDTGVGMSDEVKKKLFDPFFTTKDVGKGTGLGLSISYGIIEKHHGKIEVKSEPGKGTEFIITLPVKNSGTQFS